MPSHLFNTPGLTASASRPEPFIHKNRYSQLKIGNSAHADFGGGTLNIQTSCEDGNFHTFKSITAVSQLDSATMLLELPNREQIQVELVNATNPDLYIEHKNQPDQ